MEFQKRYWPFYTIIALSIILMLFFFFDWWPALRGGHGWRWPYVQPEMARFLRLLPAAFVIVAYLIGVHKLRKAPAITYLIWCIIGATIIPVLMLLWYGNPIELLFTRTVSGLITGGFSVGAKMGSLDGMLQRWPDIMSSLESESIHIALSLPGWPIAYYGAAELLDVVPVVSDPMGMAVRPILCNNVPLMDLSNAQLASSWVGIASPFWAALTVVPLYFLGRSAADDTVSRKAIAWWPFVPSLAMFLGTLNTPTPLVFVTIVYLLWDGLTKVKTGVNWRLILAGVLTAAAITLTFAFIPLLLFAGLLTLVLWQPDRERAGFSDLLKPVVAGIQFGMGLLFVFLLYTAVAGHTPIDVLNNSLQQHFELKREYWPWLWLHSWDFIIFVGLPAFGLFIMGMTRWGRPRIRQLAWTLGLTLAIIVISGTARGETGRLWLFFMPLVLLIMADILVQLPAYLRYGLVAIQVLWLLALFTVLPTTGNGYPVSPAYEDVAFSQGSSELVSTLVDYDGLLQLNGYSVDHDANENAFIIDLHWNARQQLAAPYFFSALLVAPDGEILPAKDWQPFDYQYPTTCWSGDGTMLIDRVRLPLGENSASGDYWMSLSIFQITGDGEIKYLPAILPDGREDTQVGLGPIRVEQVE